MPLIGSTIKKKKDKCSLPFPLPPKQNTDATAGAGPVISDLEMEGTG